MRVLLLSLTLALSACRTTAQDGWRCMAQPTMGLDAKRVAHLYGYELRCTYRW